MSEHRSPYLHHHFDTLEQQRQSASLGMWVFIAQEVMFFGGLFLAYTYYRSLYPEVFAIGSHQLDLWWGFFNTIMLICSSLTMALAVRAAQTGNKQEIIKWLWATMFFGTVFLGVKCVEYSGKWEHHLVPGKHFHYSPHHGAEVEEEGGFSLAGTVRAEAVAVAEKGEVHETDQLEMAGGEEEIAVSGEAITGSMRQIRMDTGKRHMKVNCLKENRATWRFSLACTLL